MDVKTTYQNLREEMMIFYNRQEKLHIAAYTISVSMWTIAISQSMSWIALVPMIILIPISFRMCEYRKSIVSLSAYMIVCLEGKSISDWEYIHNEFAQNKEFYNIKNRKSSIYNVSKFTFTFLNFACALIFWIVRGNFRVRNSIWIGILLLILQISITVIQTIIWTKNINNLKYKTLLMQDWQKVREKYETRNNG